MKLSLGCNRYSRKRPRSRDCNSRCNRLRRRSCEARQCADLCAGCEHGGRNWGFQCLATAHRAKGYGVVGMTNSDNGLPLLQVIVDRVGRAYGWDMLDKPLLR
jgi:hypothetical protein